jgi:hypothetical protein
MFSYAVLLIPSIFIVATVATMNVDLFNQLHKVAAGGMRYFQRVIVRSKL